MRGANDGLPQETAPIAQVGSIIYDKYDGQGPKVYQLLQAKVAASSSGDNTIVAAATGKKIVVLGWTLINKGTIIDAKWVDGTGGTDLTGPMTLPAAAAAVGGGIQRVSENQPLTPGTVSTLLALNLSGAQVVNGSVWYITV